MKRTLIIFATIASIASCKQKDDGAFTVNGSIVNATGKKVLLMQIPYEGSQPVVVDSITLDQKGEFTLKGAGKAESIYRLAIDKGPDVILINDRNDVHLKMDINDYRHYTLDGSPASESLHTLFENYSRKDSVLLTTFQQLQQVQKVPGQDSVVTMLTAKKDAELQDLNSVVKEFITKSESPAARVYALGLASRTMNMEELRPLIDASAAKFKDHDGINSIKRIMDVQALSKPPVSKLVNQQAPEIAMPDVNGNVVSLSSLKGKYVLVDFWASWCGPCRNENPNVVAAYNQFKNKNFTVLGVSLDQDKAAWKAAIAKDKLTWTHISDLKQWESAAVPAYGIEAIPFNVLLDPTGKIIATGLHGQGLLAKLTEVLK